MIQTTRYESLLTYQYNKVDFTVEITLIIQGRKTHNYKRGRKSDVKEDHHVPRGALSSGPASMIWHYLHLQFRNGDQKKGEKLNSEILTYI